MNAPQVEAFDEYDVDVMNADEGLQLVKIGFLKVLAATGVDATAGIQPEGPLAVRQPLLPFSAYRKTTQARST